VARNPNTGDDVGARDRGRRRTEKVIATVRAGRARVKGTRAEDLATRLHEADLINQAMNLAALTLMIFFPFVITVAAFSPLHHGGAADLIIRRMGLDPEAAAAVERLFTPRGGTVITGWTAMGVVWLILGGLSLAASLQSIYARVLELEPAGLRGILGQLLWLAGLVAFFAATTALGAVLTGTVVGQIGYGVLVTAGLLLFLWAGTRVLTMGRLGWRTARPIAVFTTIGMIGLGVVGRLYFSASIVANERTYGQIGVVFVILSWLIGVGVVLAGGAVVGGWYADAGMSVLATLRRYRTGRYGGDTPTSP
jgi:membrane protein